MIEVPDFGNDFHQMWVELIHLGRAGLPAWTLIGAQMVALHGWVAGRQEGRPSVDADVLVNVRVVSAGTAILSAALQEAGFVSEGHSPRGIGHRFRKEGVLIDILGPEGLGRRADLRTVGAARTIEVPGGTQALRRSVKVKIRTRAVEGLVPVPSLLGAILLKVRAISVDDRPEVQRADLAFLLTLVDEPDPLADQMSRTERGWLRRHPYLGDPRHGVWRDIALAEQGAIVFRRLSGEP